MDTNYGSFAAGCLKTARQKKRLQKEDRDKQLIRIHRLQEKLLLQRRALPLVPIDEPYQKGWKRTFILREDVAVSIHAAFYRELLGKINTVMYSVDRSFKKRIRRRNRKKLYEVIPQSLRAFYLWEWTSSRNKLTDREKVHFHPETCWDKGRKVSTVQYVFNEPWRFVLQVKPHMITHTRMVDEALEQQIQQLDNYIQNRKLWPRMHRLINGKSYDRWCGTEKAKYRNILKNKPLYQVLEEAGNDQL